MFAVDDCFHIAKNFIADFIKKDINVVKLLIAKGADLNAKDKDGKTALIHARESIVKDKENKKNDHIFNSARVMVLQLRHALRIRLNI
jgi:hypothetical protein